MPLAILIPFVLAAPMSGPAATIVRLDSVKGGIDLSDAQPLGGPFYRVTGRTPATLRSQPGVRWAVREGRRRILLDQLTPDASEPWQWHLYNDGSRTDLWPRMLADADINARPAWLRSEGSSATVVAVLDGGIPADHPDLPSSARLPGWDFVDDDDDPSPEGSGSLQSHGTGVAALILGARSGPGVVGVCPRCSLLPVRILAPDSTLRDGDLIAALLWAAERADVLNASWSFDPMTFVSPAVHDALRWAARHGRNGRGVVVVFSAGNRATAVDPFAPQAMAETITVAATDETDERAGYSNTGPSITLAAPGGVADEVDADGERVPRAKIVTADLEGEAGNNPSRDANLAPGVVNDLAVTATFQGTSAAAPQVAGAAALLLSVEPTLTANEVAWLLTETAAAVGAQSYGSDGRNHQLGYGRLDLGAAMALLDSGAFCRELDEICDNALDDDCDRRVDEADPDCGAEVVRAFELDLTQSCETNDECGDGYCGRELGSQALRSCTADCDFDCPADGLCLGLPGDAHCVLGCRRSEDCPAGTRCDFPDSSLVAPGQEALAACLPLCAANSECGAWRCRDDGVCAVPPGWQPPVMRPPPEEGCDCGAAVSPVWVLLLAALRWRRRQQRRGGVFSRPGLE